MGKFCSKHCGERTDHELAARRAALSIQQRTSSLSSTLESELARIEAEQLRREGAGESQTPRTAALLQASKSDRTG